MLSLKECKRILNKNGNNLTDEEVEKVRDLLLELVQIEARYLEKTNKADEDGSNNEQGEQRRTGSRL